MGAEPYAARRPSRRRKKNGEEVATTPDPSAPRGVEALLAYALGVMHLPFADFCCLTPDELALCAGAFARERTDTQRAAWERTRTLAAIAVQPHVKGKVAPKRLLPLPWDNEHPAAANRPTEPQPTKEQALQRVRQLLGKPSN